MFCPKCGFQQPSAERVCVKCASPLPATGILNPRIPTANPASAPPAPPVLSPWEAKNVPEKPSSLQPEAYKSSYYPGKYLGSYSPDYQPNKQVLPAINKDQSSSSRAIWTLVMGLMGFSLCPVFSIVAIVLGWNELGAIKEGIAPEKGKTITQVGFYLGIGNVVLYTMMILFFTLLLALGAR